MSDIVLQPETIEKILLLSSSRWELIQQDALNVLIAALWLVDTTFLLAFAVGAVLAAYERRPAAVRPFLVGSLALLACSLGVSLLHLARFHDGPGRWVWFTVHAVGVVSFAVAVATLGRGVGQRARLATAEP